MAALGLSPSSRIDVMSAGSITLRILIVFALVSTSAGVADAQWLLLGRKVVGKVESMVQSPDSSKPQAPRYDIAIVTLDAPAAKVYDTVVATVAEHPDYRYLQRNDLARSIEITNGKKSAGVHVIALNDKLSQLIIASVIQPGETSPVPFALQNVLRICQKVKVTCTVSTPP
jgi:hypothetical protein